MILAWLVAFALGASVLSNALVVEEFHAHGPTEFHDLAINKFVEMRKANPDLKLDSESPFLKQATSHAIKRGMRKADEEYELRVRRSVIVCDDSSVLC